MRFAHKKVPTNPTNLYILSALSGHRLMFGLSHRPLVRR